MPLRLIIRRSGNVFVASKNRGARAFVQGASFIRAILLKMRRQLNPIILNMSLRIGIDLGGTKIEGVVMDSASQILARRRLATPQTDYSATVRAIVGLVAALETEVGARALPVGMGTPGAISARTGRMKNCNSTCLNGQLLLEDVQAQLGARVRIANDADCLALSESHDGAAHGARSVFAVIVGTGVGGGVVINGQLLTGPNAIAGEWGHNPLPWPRLDWDEVPGPLGWDGRHGAIEDWCSGPALAADYARRFGAQISAREIAARAEQGEAAAQDVLARWEDRLARALATVINVLDPEVIVLGGGLSHIARVYRAVPQLWRAWVFSDEVQTRLVRAQHGDASGVRGAAWLWPAQSKAPG